MNHMKQPRVFKCGAFWKVSCIYNGARITLRDLHPTRQAARDATKRSL